MCSPEKCYFMNSLGTRWPSGRSRFRILRVPGSKPDSTEDPSCLWAWCMLILTWVKFPSDSVEPKFGEEGATSSSDRVQNYEIRPKLALELH
ncbi:hypothetical protein AVEN_14572-1 [Araneus ventricosus]|uniref:Uncharacterized protein n=1 Tax=Araneus ventricosus TaxID=182803 RepID=A0A4Y2CGT4_ARAVE|nr:hypothetical protein AVEN_14572-1 [Araneus ventricosus]